MAVHQAPTNGYATYYAPKNGYTFQASDYGYIYISHLDKDLQYWRIPVLPDSISDSMTTTFAQTQALGRSAPVFTFSHAGPRTVQVSIKLHRDIMDDVNMSWSNATLGYNEDYVDNLLRALQAIAVPKYNLSNKAVQPPMVALRLGNQIFIKGVVTSAPGVTYNKPILDQGQYGDIQISLTVSEVDPYDATAIYANGGFRGVVSTLNTAKMGF